MREWLEWERRDFVEYDLDSDPAARRRLSELSGGQRSVPVLIEDNKIIRIGWQGRACMVEADVVNSDVVNADMINAHVFDDKMVERK